MAPYSTILRYPGGDLVGYFVSVLTLLIIYWLRPWLRSVLVAFKLPGPPALPILGNVLMGLDSERMRKLAEDASTEYGPVARGWMLLRPIFGVLEPQYLHAIMHTSKNTDKNFFYLLMHGFIGKGLITNNGNDWKLHRKYIQPYFTINILDTYLQTFLTSAKCLVDELKGKYEVNITTFMNDAVLDILHEAVLGVPIIQSNGEKSTYTKDSPYRKGQVVILQRLVKPWLLFDKLYKWSNIGNKEVEQKTNLQLYTRMMLERKREEHKQGTIAENRCLLEMLMEIAENNDDFNDDDIINETCTFMLAGQDSVGAAASFALYHLAGHQAVQRKVMEELDTIFQGSDRAPTIEDIKNMKYLEQCIKETMRLCPSVPFFARTLSEDVKVGKHILPANSDIIISPYVTHRLEKYYPDPEKYNPERFSPEMCEKRHPYAYLPFSAGPRNCIGYKFAYIEMKAVISEVIRKYHLSIKPGYQVRLGYRVTLRAHGGIWIKLKPRKNLQESIINTKYVH